MKQFGITLFTAFMLVCIASCAKPEKDAKLLAGDYYGDFTNQWCGQNDTFMKKDVMVQVKQNPSAPAQLMLEEVASLTVSNERYRYELDTKDAAIVERLIGVCAENDNMMCGGRIEDFRRMINRVKIDAHFGSSELALKIIFCNNEANSATTEFTGTKSGAS